MKILGLISVLMLCACLVYAQIHWGPDYYKTFSRLVAQKRTSIVYYFVVFFLFLVAFSVFMFTSFIPHFALSKPFAWIYILGAVSQLVCVSVPETGGYKTKIHLVAAGIMSASTLLQVALLMLFAHLSAYSLVVGAIGLIIMISIWVLIILKHALVKYELGLQSVYFASYLGVILLV